MRAIIIRTVVAVSLLAASAPALAQGLAREIEQQIEQSAREVARQIESQVRELAQQVRPRPQPRRSELRGPQETERISRTARIGAGGTLDLLSANGNVTVTGGSGSEVVIEALKRTFGPRARLQDVEIDVRELGNRVEVRTRYANGRDIDVAIDYTITLPQNARVLVRSANGNVRTINVRGEVRIETTNGNIQSSGAIGPGSLKTVSGNVTLTDVQVDDDLTASTINGDLVAQNVRGRRVSMVSVGGDARLTDIDCEQAMVRSTHGDIAYAGAVRPNGRYELTTHNGDITMAIATSGFDIDAGTFNGDINSSFPLTLGGGTPGRRRGAGDTIRGTFGDGGAVLVLRSFNGDIALSRR